MHAPRVPIDSERRRQQPAASLIRVQGKLDRADAVGLDPGDLVEQTERSLPFPGEPAGDPRVAVDYATCYRVGGQRAGRSRIRRAMAAYQGCKRTLGEGHAAWLSSSR